MLWPLSVVLVANTNGRLAIPALAGLLVNTSIKSHRFLLKRYYLPQWRRRILSQVEHGECVHEIRQKSQNFLHKCNKLSN